MPYHARDWIGIAASTIAFGLFALFPTATTLAAQPAADPPLLLQARQHFNGNSETKFTAGAGEEFFRAVGLGESKDFRGSGEDTTDRERARSWPESRVILADWIVWLCTDRNAAPLVTYHGIDITGARIDGAVDLSYAQIPFPLLLRKCVFTDGISLLAAALQDLDLSGSSMVSLHASSAQVKGRVLLTECVVTKGEVNFAEATVAGDLRCEGAQFGNPGDSAFMADEAQIAGSVLLTMDPASNGKNFVAQGDISLNGAVIGGDLDFTGAHLFNLNGSALEAAGAKIGGNVRFSDGFSATGAVDLTNAAIANDFYLLHGASFADAFLDMTATKAARLSDDTGAWPQPGSLFMDGFAYESIETAAMDLNRRLDWLSRIPTTPFNPQPYEQLATVLKSMGYDDMVADVLVAKNQVHGNFVHAYLGQNKSVLLRWWARLTTREWWWYKILGPCIGYGYRPERAFFASLMVIAFGCFLFQRGFAHGLMWPTEREAVKMSPSGEPSRTHGRLNVEKDYPRFNAFIFSLETFTPLLQLDQNDHWYPNANRGRVRRVFWGRVTTGGLLRGYLWVHIILGWVLTSLWVGAVTGLAKS